MLWLALLASCAALAGAADEGMYPLLMPNVKPERAESYFCTPIKIDDSKTYFITGFVPNATMDTAHHMLIYGSAN